MANRTSAGNVTQEARDEHGDDHGKFPIFDQHSALSAIKLRHNGKGVSASSVLARVAHWASSNGNKTVQAAVEADRIADRGK